MTRFKLLLLFLAPLLVGCAITPLGISLENGLEAMRKGEYYRAVDQFNEAIKQAPQNCKGYIGKGLALYYLDLPKRALSVSNEMLKKGLDCESDIYYSRSIFLTKTNHYDSFVRSRDRALKLGDYDIGVKAEFYNRLGYFWLLEGSYDTAVLQYNRALELDSDVIKFWANRGIVHFRKGNNAKALADFNEVIQRAPDAHKAYYIRSQIWQRRGRAKRAIKDARRAFQIKENEKYKKWLSQLEEYQRRGQPESMSPQAAPIQLPPSKLAPR